MRLVNALRSGLTGLTMAGGVAAVLGLASVSARADTIVSQLNCPIVGGTACTSTTASYGTLTFSDDVANANNVDIGIALGSGLTIQQLVLNYDQSKFGNATPFAATIGGVGVSVENSVNNVTLLGSGNFGGFVINRAGRRRWCSCRGRRRWCGLGGCRCCRFFNWKFRRFSRGSSWHQCR